MKSAPRGILLWSLAPLLLSFSSIVPSPTYAEEGAHSAAVSYATALSTAFENVADKITPSVVNITSIKKPRKVSGPRTRRNDPSLDPFRQFFGDDFMERFMNPDGGAQQGMGTGVIIDRGGLVLTNNHVVGEGDDISVRMHDKRTLKAEVVGRDPKSDIALLRVKADNLTPAKLGDSDRLKIGEWVIASGNPFGLDNTITAGIVSAKGRSISGGSQFEDFIQTDAAINPGNSGGPLLNLQGEVVGINTAIFSRSGGYMGIGFAIPINMVKNIKESLLTTGKVVRGWLGIGIQNLSEELAGSFNADGTAGALVGQVSEGSPAEKAGFKQGDIVTKFDGQRISDTNQLRNLVAGTKPGEEIDIVVLRDGRELTLSPKIEELTSSKSDDEDVEVVPEDSAAELGLDLQSLTPQTAKELRTKKSAGVVVTNVVPGGLADMAGIQARDIIISVDGRAVKNVREFLGQVSEKRLEKGVRLVVESGGMEHFVFLKSTE